MNKEREIDGIKVVVNGEQYEAYKGTLQHQIKKQNKYIEMLQNNIEKLVEENKELKEENIMLEKQRNRENNAVKELKSRIDKAIEYFYQLEDKGEYIHTDYIYEMIKILKGDNK